MPNKVNTSKKPIAKKPIAKKPVAKPIAKPIVKPVAKPVAKPDVLIGSLTYTASEAARRPDIIQAVERALKTYNTHANFSGCIHIDYDENVPTAHTVGYRGPVVFGGMISYRTALHEFAHYVGVGTHGTWMNFVNDGRWTGEKACAKLKEFDGPDAVLHADTLHFWGPSSGGLNYESELTQDADRRHVLLVRALADDMSI